MATVSFKVTQSNHAADGHDTIYLDAPNCRLRVSTTDKDITKGLPVGAMLSVDFGSAPAGPAPTPAAASAPAAAPAPDAAAPAPAPKSAKK